MRKILVLAALAVLVASQYASALSISTDSSAYKKADAIRISGQCSGIAQVEIIIEHEKKVVAEQSTACAEGAFFWKYQSSYLDPAGAWDIKAMVGSIVETARVEVSAVPESAYYRIVFLSPSVSDYKRTDDVRISVRITDAGVAVDDANVLAWDVDGKRISLAAEGDGKYYADYEIPYNTRVSSWEIVVVAEKLLGNQRFGGEERQFMAIGNAPIVIEKKSPQATTFELGTKIPLVVKATYFNGKGLVNPRITAKINGREFEMQSKGNGEFSYDYFPGAADLGNISIEIAAWDDAGNSGGKTIDIVTFAGVTWLIKANALYVIIAGVAVLVVSIKAYGKFGRAYKLNSLKREKARLDAIMEHLQKDYFERAVIPKETYEKRIAEFRAKASELNNKIWNLEKEMGAKSGKGKGR